MKTILISTDFSDASFNAGKYGIEIAKAFNAKIILFHSYQLPPSSSNEIPTIIDSEEMKSIAIRHLENEANKLNSEKLADFHIDCKQGPVIATILEKAYDWKSDLLLAGMKTDHKKFREIFGSTVTGLLGKSPIPMLIVPDCSAYRKIQTIALAFESDAAGHINPHLLDSLREIAERFQSNVYLIRICNKKIQESFEFLKTPYRLIKMIGTTDPIMKNLNNADVTEGLMAFSEQYHVDLLAVLPHRHAWLERLFKGSTTKKLMFKMHIPLLILPESIGIKKVVKENLGEVAL